MASTKKNTTYSERPSRAARIAHAKGSAQFREYDTSAIRPKKSRAPYVVAAVVVLVVLAGILTFVLTGCSSQEDAVDLLPPDQQGVVVVTKGEGALDIADSLKAAHLIARASDFTDEVKKQDAASKLLPGAYSFDGGTSVASIVEALTIGPDATADTLVVPEGYTRTATASALEEATEGRITANEFLAATEDASAYAKEYDFLVEAGTNSLEGFLFPKTYRITAGDTAANVVRMMLDQYEIETSSLNWSYPLSQGLSQYDALTLASIVEKEAGAQNRATVASVFYNRLAQGMNLQSDATTAYEVGHDPTAEEVHANTPYSTYANPGLPPTPICSPGLACLEAVCNPETTDYLFFYFAPDANGDIQYHFSQTYEEHQNAIFS